MSGGKNVSNIEKILKSIETSCAYLKPKDACGKSRNFIIVAMSDNSDDWPCQSCYIQVASFSFRVLHVLML